MQKAFSLWDLDEDIQSASQLPLEKHGDHLEQTNCFKPLSLTILLREGRLYISWVAPGQIASSPS